MPNTGPENQDVYTHQESWIAQTLDRAENWLLKHSRAIWLILFILSLVGFGVWLSTMLSWPARDNQRSRSAIPWDNGKILVIDHPMRFLADDQSRPVHLMADSLEPISITLKLSETLPLILVSAEPSSTLKIHDLANGLVLISWPQPTTSPPPAATLTSTLAPTPTETPVPAHALSATGAPTATTEPTIGATTAAAAQSSPTLHTATPTVVALLPVLSQPQTISLNFKNANTERGLPLVPFIAGYKAGSLQIKGVLESASIPIMIETVDRANWREFARNNSFFAVLPLLVAAFGFLGRTYASRRNKRLQEATTEKLEAFKNAFLTSSRMKVNETWADLEHVKDHLQSGDWRRCKQIFDFSRAATTLQEITETEFFTWPDSWAGALVLRYEILKVSNLPLGKEQADGAITPVDSQTYEFVRVFPTYLLSSQMERQFNRFVAGLTLPDLQLLRWPPEPLVLSEGRAATNPKSITEIGLFAALTADNSLEQLHLFSEPRLFWPEHPVFTAIASSTKSMLVCGDSGCGRSALALALTRYFDASTREHVFGIYHERPATLAEAQQNLANEVLHFISQRTTLLANLTQEDRDALAALLLSVTDSKLVRQLSEPKSNQFDQEKADEDKKRKWHDIALLESRLLGQSIDRLDGTRPLQPSQWFDALCCCARKLGFRRVRIALEMTIEQYEQWRTASLLQYLAALPTNSEIPTQLVMLVPGHERDFDVRAYGITVKELRWDAGSSNMSPLVLMLQHRLTNCTQRDEVGITEFVSVGIQGELCRAARYNPRRLAQLWQYIVARNPDAERVTREMVYYAEKAIS